MSFAAKYNKGSRFDLNTKEFTEYYSLSALYKQNGESAQYQIGAIYINRKSHYGDAPVFAVVDPKYKDDEGKKTGGYFVNMPEHMLDDVKDILNDVEAIDEINAGKVGFEIEPYELKDYKGKTFYKIRYIDL